MSFTKVWKVTEVVEFTQLVTAPTRKEAKLFYAMASADTATTIKFTATSVKDKSIRVYKSI